MPFRVPGSSIFPMFFRGWNRLEPRSRRDDFGFGLAAPIADPLWALGRQFQMQELHGEDADAHQGRLETAFFTSPRTLPSIDAPSTVTTWIRVARLSAATMASVPYSSCSSASGRR